MKKVFAAIAACLIFVLCVTGCRATVPETSNTATYIEIRYWQSGFGQEYMNRIIDAFEEKYPQYNVIFFPNPSNTSVTQSLQKEQADTTDLYFASIDSLIAYTDMFDSLDDVYEMVPDGESQPLENKFQNSVKSAFRMTDGHYYAMSYAGSMLGLFYNADIIDGVSYQVPNTSTELSSLAIQLAANDIPAFIHFQDTSIGYYSGILSIWQAQYSGIDYYNNNWLQLKDAQGNTPSKEVAKSETDGRKAALEAISMCVNPTTVFSGSNSIQFNTAQTYFVNGRAAIMPNGAWLQNEMSQTGAEINLRMMKAPVISSIIKVLPDKSVADDIELSALIDAIDAAEDGQPVLQGDGYEVTLNDWNRVYEARNYVYHNSAEHMVILNKYSTAKEASKEFLRFYFSDIAGAIFANTVHQLPSFTLEDPSLVVPDDTWTEFDRQMYELNSELTIINNGGLNKSPVFTSNGLNMYYNQGVIAALCNSNQEDVKPPRTDMGGSAGIC